MLIGGKEYEVGQRIRVINAKSVLHYRYGMTGNSNKDMTGITGIITAESTYDEYERANLKVDEPYSEHYKNDMTRFKKIFEMHPNSYIPIGTDIKEIRFRNGYGSSRPEFVAKCSLDIKTGCEEWGAEPGKEYYTLKIHQITERKGC